MTVQFFGQFLIARGEIEVEELRQALDLMSDHNLPLGEFAIEAGMLQKQDVQRVHAEQRSRDISFGDLCVELGLLTPYQLVDLLRSQHERRLPIGEALVQLGHLTADRLTILLDVFKSEQSESEVERVELPDALANHRAAQPLLALFPRFLRRVGGLHVKLGEIHPFVAVPDFAEIRVSIPLRGTQGLDFALVTDADFAGRLAAATSGLSEAELDPELVVDGVGEFLNVLLGNVLSTLSAAGHPMELGAPDYETELVDGWIVDLAVDFGRAALVLSVF